MTASIDARSLRAWLADGAEIALIDVREAGQFGEGHPFFAVNLPYSQLEKLAPRLLPRRSVRTVVYSDAGDGLDQRAAARLAALGYDDLYLLQGGAQGWAEAGCVLFRGVNVPSKTFGELVEQVFHTPRIPAQELARRQAAGEPLLLVDGRTPEEYRRQTVPGALPLPNGELALRLAALLPDATTPVVVHCAGRTRSIVGAQTLRNLGLPNPVVALENGTQGWKLAGYELRYGSAEPVPPRPAADALPLLRERAARLAARHGAPVLSAAQAQDWLDDAVRTTYLIDVRSAEEFAAGSLPGAVQVPGGQLVQSTDLSVGVRNSRLLLLDDEAVRAPVAASWLRQLGFEAATVEGGIAARIHPPARPSSAQQLVGSSTYPIPLLDAAAVAARHARAGTAWIDLRGSRAYRAGHGAGVAWSIRPRITAAVPQGAAAIVLIAEDAGTAALAAQDLREAGHADIAWTTQAAWQQAGLPTEATPQLPADADAIDYLLFVHDRHDGNLDAARAYLAWETGLIGQCQPDELAVFRLPAAA
ncbi:rhodanese-like domain-containing protein [Xylophilus sp.]|uniref:rhodanese-like domain-containing protein n=1 Tax=Xylophilus sp. TaxID=2653893 RepID=UPI0013B613E4|nr:rhodanese-like domain-containing protein [Xylophilus sp.]KAF1044773.1 MAG: Thiosulfate sulfurtransferase [Xylophilus sp.]